MKSLFNGKAVPFWVAALFIIPGFVLGSQYAFYESVPEWQTGDAWTYKTTVTMSGLSVMTPDGQQVEAQEPQTEETVFTMKVINDTAEVDGIPAYKLGILGKNGIFPAGYVNKATLNPIAPKYKNGAPDGHEELPLFSWPLNPGQSWTHTVEDAVRLKFTAANRDFITVADETLLAIRIDVTVDEILEPELKQMMDDDKIQLDFTFSYWYANAVRNVARAEFKLDAKITEGGNEVAFKIESITELVRGTGLATADDSGDIGAVDGLVINLPDALNINEGDTATFSVATLGTAPADAVYKWLIDGVSYTGQTVDAKFTEQGVKNVEVGLYKGDSLIAETASLYEVYWAGELTGTNSLTGSTREFELDLAEGGMLSLVYQAASMMPTWNPNNDMSLLDPEGEELARSAEIMVPIMEEGTYTVRVRAAALEYANAPFTITGEVRYGPMMAVGVPMTETSTGWGLHGGFFDTVQKATRQATRVAGLASGDLASPGVRLA